MIERGAWRRHHGSGPAHLCWFVESASEVHFSSGASPEALVIDIGSGRSVQSPVSPFDFMAIFGLRRAMEDPYCGVLRERLVPVAARLVGVARDHPGEYRQFRHVLAAARTRKECPVTTTVIPDAVRPLVGELAALDGWIRRALPDHQVQTTAALYLLSCKNEHLTDRFFPHLDRFRALTAEFGESRTRPVLLSTTDLEPRHVRRCDAYEIGEISGRTLLDLIDRSLRDEPDALLKGLLTVSRGAPRAGLA